jgi:hypothetical protein
MTLRTCFGALACLVSAIGQEPHDHSGAGAANAKIVLLPRDTEMRFAVNALPKALRDGASIRVLEASAYVKARQGSNPFTCMVSRRSGNFYPVCFDEEGARTIMPCYEDDALMRLKGMTGEEVERQLAKGFADGKYVPPSRPGIAYMLSPANYMIGSDGKLARNAPPHTMFYAPFLTDGMIGGMPGRTAFIDRPGPHGMFIVVAGQKERETYLAEAKDLMEEIEKQTGLK